MTKNTWKQLKKNKTGKPVRNKFKFFFIKTKMLYETATEPACSAKGKKLH